MTGSVQLRSRENHRYPETVYVRMQTTVTRQPLLVWHRAWSAKLMKRGWQPTDRSASRSSLTGINNGRWQGCDHHSRSAENSYQSRCFQRSISWYSGKPVRKADCHLSFALRGVNNILQHRNDNTLPCILQGTSIYSLRDSIAALVATCRDIPASGLPPHCTQTAHDNK